MNFPETRRENINQDIFGFSIPDPYRWLENADTLEVKEWVDAQNTHTDKTLRGDMFRDFSDELEKNFKVSTFSSPISRRGRYFYAERLPSEEQHVLYVKTGIDGAPIKLVDPNGMNSDNTISLDWWRVSRSGNYVAYGLSQGGDEMPTLHIKDTATGRDLDEKILRCKSAQPVWLPDDSGFFYCRYPSIGTVPKNEEHLHSKVYFHKLGNDPKNDELVFGEGRPKDDMITLFISLDGRFLGISVSQKWTENDIYIYDRETKQTTSLVSGVPARFFGFFAKDKIFVRTNYKANNYRVLASPISSMFAPIDEWEEIIKEKEYVLESLSQTEDKIIAEYLVDACSRVELFDHCGGRQGEIFMPQYSTLAEISTNREEREFFYGIVSFTTAKTVYRYVPDENRFAEYRRTDNPINPNDYTVKQEWCVSKDHTRVPVFIIHRKNVVPGVACPTILYGYGGFGSIEAPSFVKSFVPWLESGGMYAVTNIRGGGEFGETWHKDGARDKKQNSFDDFISVAEYLIEQSYTSSEHLGIFGGSNGGLLVAAVAVQRPDLFKAVLAKVPLTDMVRFPLFGMAIRWVHEYGDPKNENDLKNILKWSPYHNVRNGVEYPAFFFTTGEKDSRVDPLHARKMAAMLQSVNQKSNVLLFTEKEAGHGAGKPIKKIVEGQALALTFFAKELGLRIRKT